MSSEMPEYKPLSKKEDAATTSVVATGIGSTATEHGWMDNFYQEEEGIVRVFDVDNETLKRTTARLQRIGQAVFVSLIVILLLVTGKPHGFAFMFFVVRFAMFKWPMPNTAPDSGVHVALTRNGIRKDSLNFPNGNVFRTTVHIPYTQIKKIELRPARGISCFQSRVILHNEVDSTLLAIEGLVDPEDFIASVEAQLPAPSDEPHTIV